MIRNRFLPQTVVCVLDPENINEEIRSLMPIIADKHPVDGKTTVYICEGFACQAPMTSVEQLQAFLDGISELS